MQQAPTIAHRRIDTAEIVEVGQARTRDPSGGSAAHWSIASRPERYSHLAARLTVQVTGAGRLLRFSS